MSQKHLQTYYIDYFIFYVISDCTTLYFVGFVIYFNNFKCNFVVQVIIKKKKICEENKMIENNMNNKKLDEYGKESFCL